MISSIAPYVYIYIYTNRERERERWRCACWVCVRWVVFIPSKRRWWALMFPSPLVLGFFCIHMLPFCSFPAKISPSKALSWVCSWDVQSHMQWKGQQECLINLFPLIIFNSWEFKSSELRLEDSTIISTNTLLTFGEKL